LVSVFRDYCVLSGRGFYVGLITRPESYRVCVCVIDCDAGATVKLYIYSEYVESQTKKERKKKKRMKESEMNRPTAYVI